MNSEPYGSTADVRSALPPNDYVSPGLAVVMPDAAFPNMMVGDTSVPRWPWLRRWVEQNWYIDRRNPSVGFASRDEAAILHNNALLFRGKPCLEVGCWRGWSAVHIALGSGSLDIIDPVFGDPGFTESIRASCEAAGVMDRVTFHQGVSPGAIDTLSQSTGSWSFIFIDADHEGDAPRLDAEAAIRNAASTAMVMFHDLASPYVAAGLDAMRNAGWRTMVYQTMQIMGVAWRGNVEPVAHSPDPNVFWTLPRHLLGYQVSGWQPSPAPERAWWPDMTIEDRRNAAMLRAQAAEDDRITALGEAEHQAAILRTERDGAVAVAVAAQLELLQAELTHEVAALTTKLNDALAEVARIHPSLMEAEHQVASLQAARDAELSRSAVTELECEQAIERAQAGERRVAELAAACQRQERYLDGFRSLEERVLTFAARQERENAAMLELARWIVHKRVLAGLLRRSADERIATLKAKAVALGLDGLVTGALVSMLCPRRMLLGLLRRPHSFGESLVGYALLRAAQAWRSDVLAEMALRIEGSGC
jgi:predicted O-methyltransferase YrrM